MTDVTPRFPLATLQPGSYSQLDASALQDAESDRVSPVVAVIGDCAGGKPGVPLTFSRQQTLKEILRSGPALDVARAALIGGAPKVAVVRVGNGISQAVTVLPGTTGVVLTLTSIGYGAWTSNIKRQVLANNTVVLSYTDPNGNAYTETYALGAGVTADQIADAINGLNPAFAKSSLVTAKSGTGTMPAAVTSLATMPGGADTGTIVSGDWTTALTALETTDVALVVAATGDASVHAQVTTHCDAMSVPSVRRERVQVAGAIAGESIAQQVTRMNALRNKRAQLVYPGVSLPDLSGVTTAYAPFVAAGYIAGKHAGLPDQATALTHADLSILDVEKPLSAIAGGDIDQLLAASVSPIAPTPGGGFWLVDSLSGYQADGSFRDFHKIRTADEVARRLRTRLETKFVGGKSLTGTKDRIRIEAIAELTDQVAEELLRDFLLSQVAVVADPLDPRRYLVQCPVMLPDTTKFILITIALQPASARTA